MRYDAIVIGSGAAGYYFAIASERMGKRVALIERDVIGGTAFATGCLPVKRHLENLKVYKRFLNSFEKYASNFEIDGEELFRCGKQKVNVIDEELKERLDKTGIDIIFGEAELVDGNKVKVEDTLIEGEKIILATGTKASTLGNWSEIDESVILSHEGALKLAKLPEEIVILGANVEGIEFASMFSAMGVKVKVIEQEDYILKGNDRDLVNPIEDELLKNEVELLLNTRAKSIERKEDRALITLDSGKIIETKKILITGIRKPNIPKCNGVDLKLENGFIKTDKNLESSVRNIFVIGDINGRHGMAHIAIQQAIMLSDYLWNRGKIKFEYETLPCAMFTIPELAGAGWQENQHENSHSVSIDFDETIRSGAKGKLKLVLDGSIVKGAWMSGLFASDYMGQVSLWIDEGLSLDEFKEKLWIHPTIGESFLECSIKREGVSR